MDQMTIQLTAKLEQNANEAQRGREIRQKLIKIKNELLL
jgi:hypothetical protein